MIRAQEELFTEEDGDIGGLIWAFLAFLLMALAAWADMAICLTALDG